MWLVKLAVILLEGWVAKDTLKEVTAHRKSGSGSLTQGSGAEVETAVFASYPGTNYELGLTHMNQASEWLLVVPVLPPNSVSR